MGNFLSRLTAEAFGLLEYLEPTSDEKLLRKKIHLKVQEILRKKWKNCNVYAYGSSENGFGFSTSDIDMCLFLEDKDYKEYSYIYILQEASNYLKESFYVIDFIQFARIPILKLQDPESKICCDLSLNNPLALKNSSLLQCYSETDLRLRPLVYVLKYWAKQRNLNDPSNGTLSSYAYVLMVIHFLQTRESSLLPCFPCNSNQIETNEIIINSLNLYKTKNSSYGNFSCNSVGSLLIELFHYYSYEFNYRKYVINIRQKSLLEKSKRWKNRLVSWRFSIEDPYEEEHDIGKVIFHKKGQEILIHEFQRAYSLLMEKSSLNIVCSLKKIQCYICYSYKHTPRECFSLLNRIQEKKEIRSCTREKKKTEELIQFNKNISTKVFVR